MIARICPALFACVVLAGPAGAHGTNSHAEKTSFVPANLQMEVKAFGRTGSPDAITRTIEVSMSDEMRFEPSVVHVKTGETIRFVVANGGATLHEMVIGASDDLVKHAELMQRFPGMEHAEPFMAHADEGQQAEIIWTFDRPGTFEYGCLIPGHFEAGMKGTIYVETDPVAAGGGVSHGIASDWTQNLNDRGR
jgi:uncharacterized cupredoxin-like copper-binding protein